MFDLLIFSTLLISVILGSSQSFSHFSINISSSVNEIDFFSENEFFHFHFSENENEKVKMSENE